MKLFNRPKKKKQVTDEDLTKNTLESGVSDVLDVISPDGLFFPEWKELLERKNGYMQLNSRRFTRVYMIKQHPAHVYTGYLNEFYSSLGDVDVSIHVHPGNPDDDAEELNNILIKLETQLINSSTTHSATDAVVEASFYDTKELRDRIMLNADRMFYVSTYLSISADSLEQLDKLSEEVERLAGRKMMRMTEAFLEEDLAYMALSPLGVNPIDDNHSNFNLGASTALFPFDSAELTHPNGTYVGRNLHTNAPIFFNNFIGGQTLPAIHMNVIGRTRSGKSTFCKILIARDACRAISTLVFDPDGEYGDVVRQIGGQEISLQPGKFCGFNFFDVEVDELARFNKKENPLPLLAKTEETKTILLFMMEKDGKDPLTLEEEGMLESAIKEDYHSRGIRDGDPDSLYEEDQRAGAVGMRKKEMPTISSVSVKLQEMYGSDAERMNRRLLPFKMGGTLGMFDGQTEIDIRGLPAVNFNLKALDSLPRLRPLAMHILQNYTWEYFVKKDLHVKKRVLFDEAWLFTKINASLDFFEQLARRAAKRNCTFTLATQNIREFTATPEGRVVLAQAGVSLLFQQHPSDLKEIQSQFDLPDGQVEFIRTLKQGQCLFRVGEQATGLGVEVMEYEQDFVFTTAGEWGVGEQLTDEVREYEEVAP